MSVRYLTEVNPKINVLYWDGDNIIAEQLDQGELKTYLRGHELIAKNQSGMVYYVQDEHGSISRVVNASGTNNLTYEYDAFGTERNPKKEDDNPFRYCGEYLDFETNTYYLRSRSYRTTTGRFLTEDPYWKPKNIIYGEEPIYNGDSPVPDIIVIMASSNLYAYCNNNPVNLYDSLGLAPGDKFKSMDKAAIDFGNYIGPASIVNDWEYGAYLYSWEETYEWEETINYNYSSITRSITQTYYSYTEPFTDKRQHNVYLDANPTIPKGSYVAGLHTHGAYSKTYVGESFSDDDIAYAKRANNGNGVYIYVLTPMGYLYRYDPNNPSDKNREPISKDMPYDASHPDIEKKLGIRHSFWETIPGTPYNVGDTGALSSAY